MDSYRSLFIGKRLNVSVYCTDSMINVIIVYVIPTKNRGMSGLPTKKITQLITIITKLNVKGQQNIFYLIKYRYDLNKVDDKLLIKAGNCQSSDNSIALCSTHFTLYVSVESI